MFSFQHLLSNLSELQLVNRGSWGPPMLGAGFLYRILFPSDLQLTWYPTDWTSSAPSYIIVRRSPGGLGAHSAGFLYCILSPTGLVSELTDFLSSPSYIIVQRPLLPVGVANRTHSTHPRSSLYPDIPRPDAPVIYTDAFPILTAWPGSICYIYILSYI